MCAWVDSLTVHIGAPCYICQHVFACHDCLRLRGLKVIAALIHAAPMQQSMRQGTSNWQHSCSTDSSQRGLKGLVAELGVFATCYCRCCMPQVLDLKRFLPSRELQDGLLWVVEQLPGMVEAADMTHVGGAAD